MTDKEKQAEELFKAILGEMIAETRPALTDKEILSIAIGATNSFKNLYLK